MIFDPVRYLPLIEPKIGALDQAAPPPNGTCPRNSKPCGG
jgi:hypothetical protein